MKGRHRSRRGCSLIERLESRWLLATFNPLNSAALSSALSSAQLGDTIILKANTSGTVYTGPFTLPNKTTGSGWITIQSENAGLLPAEGTRVTPADAPNMARIQAGGSNVSALSTATSAHHFKLVGIEFVGPATGSVTQLVSLGTDTTAQSTYASVPHHIIIDRSYMRPVTPTASIRRAVALNSAFTDITNSWIEDIHQAGNDSQAIGGWNGTGPYNIINNHLEGASENVMFGGGTHRIPGYTPSDIVIRNNHIVKPLEWRGAGYNVKNLFELKTGRRVLLEGNILENNWVDGQDGTAIVLKLGNWSSSQHLTTEEIVIRNNIIRHSNNAIAIQGRDYSENSPPGLVRGFTFTNNLFYDINNQWAQTPGSGIGGNLLYMTHGPQDVVFDHNTFDNARTIVNVDTPQYPINKFVFTNNIVAHNTYGFFGHNASGQGDPVWTMYFNKPNDRLLKNVIMDDEAKATLYDNTARPAPHAPNLRAVNFWPTSWAAVGFVDQAGGDYRLAPGSIYNNAGTDGFDVGADIDLINASVAGAESGSWSSSFATMAGNTLMLQFDGTTTPITLGVSGANITATRGATTLSFAGVTRIHAHGTLGDDILQINGTITQPLTFSNGNGPGDALNVLSGTHTIPADLATPIRNVSVTVNAGATANLNATQHLGSLTVNGLATLSSGGAKMIVTRGLAVAGKLNLGDNDLVLDYDTTSQLGSWNGSNYTGVSGMIASGRNGGSFDGNGLITTQSMALNGQTMLAVGEASDVLGISGSETGMYGGESVDATTVIVKYTWSGDANLDGELNGDDYFAIDSHILQNGSVFGFGIGDFDLNGELNGDDYFLIDSNILFAQGHGAL